MPGYDVRMIFKYARTQSPERDLPSSRETAAFAMSSDFRYCQAFLLKPCGAGAFLSGRSRRAAINIMAMPGKAVHE
jgi:hypothetical protein